MEDNISKLISKALVVDKVNLVDNIKSIIEQVKLAIASNKATIIAANGIDKRNNNGFIIDFDIINNIFNNLEHEDTFYGKVILSQKDDKEKIIYGKQIMDCGNVIVINDGNPYVIIELSLRNILAGNTTIFVNNGFMYGTNQLLIQLIQSVLEQFNISKDLVQIYVSDTYDEVLANYANIDLVIGIGDHDLQSLVLEKSKNRTIVSGYENFDIYVESDTNKDFIDKIMNTGLNIQMYLNSDKLDYPNAIIVSDIDEAIAQINYNGHRYSAAIFTNDSDNASKFIKEVKSKIVTVNSSPTIERIMDIKETDLVNEKTIIYPLSFKVDTTGEKVSIEKDW